MDTLIDRTPKIQKLTGHHEMLKIDPVGEGFIVEYPILSLDAPDEANFNFCSSISELYFLNANQTPKRQTLLSQEAFNYLKWRGISGNFLPCPYFRPISLGNLTVELLPSGEGCGSSFLRIKKNESSAFYAHNWSSFESKAVRSHAFKESSTLILRLKRNPQSISHVVVKKEFTRALEVIQKVTSAKEWVVAVCSSFGPSHIILSEMHKRQVPCYVDSKTHKTLQSLIVDTSPDELARWIVHPKKISTALSSEEPGLILLCKENLKSVRWLQLPDAIWFWLGDDLEEVVPRVPNWISGIAFSEVFPIHFTPDLPEMMSLVQQIKPENVIVSGSGAESVSASIIRQGIQSRVLAPQQLTLF